ncbi:hypothetical protein LY284_06855 [Caballeronia sp. PC1]|nr:hypothetical protein [Caballeronia sp. PC1]MCE4568821.1 hypothetical protein [Caballeronia sp. CLC5]
MPHELRNSLWNALCDWKRNRDPRTLHPVIWREFWKLPADSMPQIYDFQDGDAAAWKQVRDYFFNSEWNRVYDLLDFLIQRDKQGRLAQLVNGVLMAELAAYRVIEGQIVPVTSDAEVKALEMSLALKGPFAAASEHLATALALLSNRQHPDYRNSIKESISAVEAAARVICGKEKATLGEALGILGKKGALHSALKSAYSSLYGYTNDADGIRHALMDEPNLTADDAKYFLIVCSAFVNYLKTLA